MLSLLVFNIVMEIKSVMFVFSTKFCVLLLLKPSLWFTSPTPTPPPKVKVQYNNQTVCGCEGVGDGGVELCWIPYSAGV
jgi:hypothetical protein